MATLNRAQRGYADLLFPRTATTNSMGNSGNANGGTNHYTVETYRRYGLHIAANAAVNPVPLKQDSPNNIVLFYQNATQMQVNNITSGVPITSGQVVWPGWWLTNSGTSLAATMNSTGGTGQTMVLNGAPQSAFFGHEPCTANSSISTGSQTITFTTVQGWPTTTAYTNGASVIVDVGSNFEVVTISSVSTTGSTVTFTATYAKSHASGCFIGLLPFPVLINNAGHSDDEVVVVTNQTGAFTYTVTRGTSTTAIWGTPYGAASNPPAHAIGARVAPLICVHNYTTAFYLNISLSCPQCPDSTGTPNQSGMRWADYFAYLVGQTLGANTFTDPEGVTRTAYDGVFIDSANTYLNPSIPWSDADGNNFIDAIGGDGPSPGYTLYTAGTAAAVQGTGFSHGVYNGITYALNKLRSLTANAPLVICTNGSNYPKIGSGIYWESMQNDFTSAKPPGNVLYRMQQQLGVNAPGTEPYPATIYNFELAGGNDLAGTSTAAGFSGTPSNYQLHRFYFSAVTTMTDGFYCIDYGTAEHGQTWLTDEMDGGAGTALTTAMVASTTTLALKTNPGWASGTTIRVCSDYSTSPANLAEDEVMITSSAITGSGPYAVNVTRGGSYNGVTQVKCLAQVGARVQTLAQQNAGQGWLGRALGAGTTQFSSLGTNLLSNPGFQSSTAPTTASSPALGYTFANWTVTNSASSLDTGHQYSGYASIEAQSAHSGSQCLKFWTLTPFKGAPYDGNINQTVTGLSLATSSAVTFSFWAKGNYGQIIEVRMGDLTNTTLYPGGHQYPAIVYVQISPVWTQYWVTAYIATSGAGASTCTSFLVQLGFGNENGIVWVDDCALQAGDPSVFTRDFEHGLVICNATAASKSVTLPAMIGPYTTYKELTGTQDASHNTGTTHAPGTSISVGPQDGYFLLKA